MSIARCLYSGMNKVSECGTPPDPGKFPSSPAVISVTDGPKNRIGYWRWEKL